jgi:hypothetical protein
LKKSQDKIPIPKSPLKRSHDKIETKTNGEHKECLICQNDIKPREPEKNPFRKCPMCDGDFHIYCLNDSDVVQLNDTKEKVLKVCRNCKKTRTNPTEAPIDTFNKLKKSIADNIAQNPMINEMTYEPTFEPSSPEKEQKAMIIDRDFYRTQSATAMGALEKTFKINKEIKEHLEQREEDIKKKDAELTILKSKTQSLCEKESVLETELEDLRAFKKQKVQHEEDLISKIQTLEKENQSIKQTKLLDIKSDDIIDGLNKRINEMLIEKGQLIGQRDSDIGYIAQLTNQIELLQKNSNPEQFKNFITVFQKEFFDANTLGVEDHFAHMDWQSTSYLPRLVNCLKQSNVPISMDTQAYIDVQNKIFEKSQQFPYCILTEEEKKVLEKCGKDGRNLFTNLVATNQTTSSNDLLYIDGLDANVFDQYFNSVEATNNI